MRQTHFAGRGGEPPPISPAADGVVRRAERPRDRERRDRCEQSGHRVDRRHLERFALAERRQDPRQAAARASFSRAGRPHQQRDCVRPPPRSRARVWPLSWPTTSARSAPYPAEVWLRRRALAFGARPRERHRRVPRVCAAPTVTPRSPTRPPRRFAGGSTNVRPVGAMRRAMGSAPRIARSEPSSPSSPTAARPVNAVASSCFVATRMPSAIGRSKAVPSFRMSAGARFTVIRRGGTANPEFTSAAPTRSRLSFTAPAGRPTIVNCGSPVAASTSTVTSYALIPMTAAERTAASMTACCRKTVRRASPERRAPHYRIARGATASRPASPTRRARASWDRSPRILRRSPGRWRRSARRRSAPSSHHIGRARGSRRTSRTPPGV